MPVDKAVLQNALERYQRGEISLDALRALRNAAMSQPQGQARGPEPPGPATQWMQEQSPQMQDLIATAKGIAMPLTLGKRFVAPESLTEEEQNVQFSDLLKGIAMSLGRGVGLGVGLSSPGKPSYGQVVQQIGDKPFTSALDMVTLASVVAPGAIFAGMRGSPTTPKTIGPKAVAPEAFTDVAASVPEVVVPKPPAALTQSAAAPKMRVKYLKENASERLLGLTKEENAILREGLAMEKLPETTVRSFKEAAAQRLDEGALHLADQVIRKPRTISDAQFAGMELKTAKLLNEARDTHKILTDALAAGDEGAASFARARYDVLMGDVDRISKAVDLSGTEIGRALSIRRMRTNMDTYDIASVTRRAMAAKGGKLTPAETAKIESAVKALEGAPDEVGQAMGRNAVDMAIESVRPKTFGGAVAETAGLLRTMKTLADMSATLRQNFMLSARRPIKAMRAFKEGAKAFFSEREAVKTDLALRKMPGQPFRERAGMYMAEHGPKLGAREEFFQSNWAEKIWGYKHLVKASERSFRTATNHLRATAFDEILKIKDATLTDHKAWADYINKASGRGDLGAFAGAANKLSMGFFAPRFAASRFQAPWAIMKYRKNPLVRNMIAKDLGSMVGVGMTALYLASLNDDVEVSTDPRKADFGKIKVGDTRIDIWAGFQQPARLIVRLGLTTTDKAGWTTPPRNKPQYTPLELAGQYGAYKLAPAVTLANELVTGESIVGQEREPWATLAHSVVPMIGEDIWEAYKDSGVGKAALAGTASFLGAGVNTYQPRRR